MSRFRLSNKLRQNDEWPAVESWLIERGLQFELCKPTGRGGHPFLRITIPGAAEPLLHYINSTPRNGGNPRNAVAKLRRAVAAAGGKV